MPTSEPDLELPRRPGRPDGRGASVNTLVERLPELLSDWRRYSSDDALNLRLGRLLARLRPLLPSDAGGRTNADHLALLLPALSRALSARPQGHGLINPWTVAGTKRREVRNAAILAALWTPAQVGEVGPQFLAEFFARCRTETGQDLPGRDELALGCRIRVENCPGPDGSDRVDLVIETTRHLAGSRSKSTPAKAPNSLLGTSRQFIEARGKSIRRRGSYSWRRSRLLSTTSLQRTGPPSARQRLPHFRTADQSMECPTI